MTQFTIISKIKSFFCDKRLKTTLVLLIGVIFGAILTKTYDYYNESRLNSDNNQVYNLYAKEVGKFEKQVKNGDFSGINRGFSEIFRDFHEFEAKFDEHFKKQRELFAKMLEEPTINDEKDNYYASVDKDANDKEIFFQLNFHGYSKNDIDVKINDDVLTFRAAKENEDKNEYLGSRFTYSFSIPNYDKDKQPEVIRSENNIVVKFFKKS